MKFSDKLGSKNVVFIETMVVPIKTYKIIQLAWDYCEFMDTVYLGFDEVNEKNESVTMVWGGDMVKDMDTMENIISQAMNI